MNTLTTIYKTQKARPPYLFIGLNASHTLSGIVPKECIIEMDWWESREVQVDGIGSVQVDCGRSFPV